MARLAYVLTGVASIADEIVQDAFLRVHANWVERPGTVVWLMASGEMASGDEAGARVFAESLVIVDEEAFADLVKDL